MIGQKIGTQHLLPYALDRLEQNPLAEGDCYPGDLLSSILRLPSEYWEQHPRSFSESPGSIKRRAYSV